MPHLLQLSRYSGLRAHSGYHIKFNCKDGHSRPWCCGRLHLRFGRGFSIINQIKICGIFQAVSLCKHYKQIILKMKMTKMADDEEKKDFHALPHNNKDMPKFQIIAAAAFCYRHSCRIDLLQGKNTQELQYSASARSGFFRRFLLHWDYYLPPCAVWSRVREIFRRNRNGI